MQTALTRPSTDHPVPHASCPSCGQTLRLARTVRGTDGLVDLQTFSCRECSLWVTEAAEERRHS
jgi:C4-type Zn-finger protein